MSVTIHDVAKHAGVGIGTVSSVLNNSRPVKEATRQKVLEAVAELDFVPNQTGRRLSMGKTHTIAVIIPYLSIASQIERLRGVMSVILETDFDVSLFTVENNYQRNEIFQTVPRRGRVDGLLIFSLQLNQNDFHVIQQEKIPTVLVESTHNQLPHIYVDDVAGSFDAVTYLIQLGHRKIAYIGDHLNDPMGNSFSRNRYLGYCQALDAANIYVDPNYYREGVNRRAEGKRLACELLAMPSPPTAVFAFSDELALGVLEAARDMEISVPDNLSVVGYDDIELAHFAQLTTVRQNLFKSGVQGVELLLDAINDYKPPTYRLQIPTELVIRHTTSPPKQED